jgi:hypothetical protein
MSSLRRPAGRYVLARAVPPKKINSTAWTWIAARMDEITGFAVDLFERDTELLCDGRCFVTFVVRVKD